MTRGARPSGAASPVPAELAARARRLRLLLFDVDGVLTDGTHPPRRRRAASRSASHIRDGTALVWARQAGLLTGVLSARDRRGDRRAGPAARDGDRAPGGDRQGRRLRRDPRRAGARRRRRRLHGRRPDGPAGAAPRGPLGGAGRRRAGRAAPACTSSAAQPRRRRRRPRAHRGRPARPGPLGRDLAARYDSAAERADDRHERTAPLLVGAGRAPRSASPSARPGSATSCTRAAGSTGARAASRRTTCRGSTSWSTNQLDLAIEEMGQAARARAGRARDPHDPRQPVSREGPGQPRRPDPPAPAAAAAPRPPRAHLRPALPGPRLPARRLHRPRHRGVQEVLRLDPTNEHALAAAREALRGSAQLDRGGPRSASGSPRSSRPAGSRATGPIRAFLENQIGLQALDQRRRPTPPPRTSPAAIDIDPAVTPAYLNLGDLAAGARRHAPAPSRCGRRSTAIAPERAYLVLERLRAAHVARRHAGPLRRAVPAR